MPSMHSTTDLIGAAEAAEIAGVKRSTITRWAEAGTLKPVTKLPGLTGAYLFARSDVEALLAPSETNQ